jgi:diaminopimelate decarboxylase
VSNTAENYLGGSDRNADRQVACLSGADPFAFERSYIKRDTSGCGAYKFIDLREVQELVKLWRRSVTSATLMYGLSSEPHHELLGALIHHGIPFCAESSSQLTRLQILGANPASISYTPSFPSGDVAAALRATKPAVITIGSPEALESIIGDSGTFVDAIGYAPKVHILVRSDNHQPYQSPHKVNELLEVLHRRGASSFGLSVLVNESEWSVKSYEQAAEALRIAALSAADANVAINSMHILGGLCGMGVLRQRAALSLDEYLSQLSRVFSDLTTGLRDRDPRFDVKLAVDAGELLVGHNPVLSRVANVVPTSLGDPDFVFIESHSYGDFAKHMFDGVPVAVAAVQDPLVSQPLTTQLRPFIIQGGSCDSVDVIRDVSTGELARFMLPSEIKTGCYVALYGHRLGNGAMDFNLIPPARVVIVPDKTVAACGSQEVSNESFHSPFMERRRQWSSSEDANRVRAYTRDFLASHRTSAGTSEVHERRDRVKRAAQAMLKNYPGLRGPVVLLDVGEYIGRLQQVDRFLKWMPHFETKEGAQEWIKNGSLRPALPWGVDRLFIPLKTLNDPVAIEVLSQLGHGYDAASSAEMAVARGAGADQSRDVIVSHPHMTHKTLLDVVAQRPWAVTVDSQSQLDRLINAGLSRDTILFVRIKASAASVVSDLSVKFGAAVSRSSRIDDASPLIRNAHAAGFSQIGLAFHVGTQCTDGKSYRTALERCQWLTDKLANEATPILIKHFNIGGGFSDERVASAQGVTQRRILTQACVQVSAFRKSVEKVVGERVYIIAEPGRVTCAAAAATLIPVVEVYNDQTSLPRIRLGCHHQGILSGNVHDEAFYELESLDYTPDARVYGGVDVLGVSGAGKDKFVPAPGTEHKITTSTKPGDRVLSFESGGAYGVNAAGAVNGIDPGGLIGFYEDDSQPHGFRFITSPLFDVEEIKNVALKK